MDKNVLKISKTVSQLLLTAISRILNIVREKP